MLKLFGSSMVPTASAITASVVAVLATVATRLFFSSDSHTVEQNRNYRIQAESVNIHEKLQEEAIDFHSFFGWNCWSLLGTLTGVCVGFVLHWWLAARYRAKAQAGQRGMAQMSRSSTVNVEEIPEILKQPQASAQSSGPSQLRLADGPVVVVGGPVEAEDPSKGIVQWVEPVAKVKRRGSLTPASLRALHQGSR